MNKTLQNYSKYVLNFNLLQYIYVRRICTRTNRNPFSLLLLLLHFLYPFKGKLSHAVWLQKTNRLTASKKKKEKRTRSRVEYILDYLY